MPRQQTQNNQNVAKVTLDKIVNDLTLPFNANYNFIDFANNMQLFNYQTQAVVNATKLLCRYFATKEETRGTNYLQEQYRRHITNYPINQLSLNKQDILYDLLADFYVSNNNQLDYSQFLNRMNFWMATGSGKTIVMIKLISIMAKLMKDDLIPTKPIMILAPDENILNQIKLIADKYNCATSSNKIDLVDLKEHWERDNHYTATANIFDMDYIRVYYYKSNNFVADKNEVARSKDGKNIYFQSYLNSNGWYVFLDEAHRGEDTTSKRKAIFNILAQDGFMFNFSATFTDDLDILTTVFDMNLSKFLKEGYGKKLYISNTEIGDLVTQIDSRVVIDNQDLNKQKTIAKTVLLLALQRKNATNLKQINPQLYHHPLKLILAGKVNSEDRGLKPFFNYLIKMVKEEWNIIDAKDELQAEIKQTYNGNFKFSLGDDTQIQLMCNQIKELTTNDIWQYVFGGNKGKIEVITFEKNKNEVAFKLVTANQPFALLVIADAVSWLRNDTSGVFELVNRSINESLFDNINSASNIAMLLGSQMFKEGWDSNRPNIVCYLGIGTNADNKKYVMQTIGRGIRIEPLHNQRKRFEHCNTNSLTNEEMIQIRKLAPILETEFVFATNSDAVNQIWTLIQEQGNHQEQWKEIHKWFSLNPHLPKRQLLIPYYKDGDTYQNNPFRTSEVNKIAVDKYLNTHKSDKVLVLKHEKVNLRAIHKLRDLDNSICINNNNNIPEYNPNYIVDTIATYFNTKNVILKRFDYLTNQIKHYNHIATTLTAGDLVQLEAELKQVLRDDINIVSDYILLQQLEAQQLSIAEYKEQLLITKEYKNMQIEYKIIKELKHLFKHHYYQPLFYPMDEEYNSQFKHVVTVKSEITFLNELCNYQQQLNERYQWWYFSKIDETLDTCMSIPYFDVTLGKSRKFYPDFIFWLKEKTTNKLLIKFVDPKGGEHPNNACDKAHGYAEIFENNNSKVLDNSTSINLYFYNQDETITRAFNINDKKYWANKLADIF